MLGNAIDACVEVQDLWIWDDVRRDYGRAPRRPSVRAFAHRVLRLGKSSSVDLPTAVRDIMPNLVNASLSAQSLDEYAITHSISKDVSQSLVLRDVIRRCFHDNDEFGFPVHRRGKIALSLIANTDRYRITGSVQRSEGFVEEDRPLGNRHVALMGI